MHSDFGGWGRSRAILLAAVTAILFAGCASPRHRAPVEDRDANHSGARASEAAANLPGAENAGKPGYYTVRQGDNLMRIGLETGQNWREIQAWNNLSDPNAIVAGQVLRVQPPVASPLAGSTAAPAAEGVVTRGVAGSKVESRPLDATGKIDTKPEAKSDPKLEPKPDAKPAAPVVATPAATPATSPSASTPAASNGNGGNGDGSDAKDNEGITWAWPVSGPVAAGFDAANKGLVFTGKAGDPVLAAADGRVVYAGSGLRGYGNLIIVKHNPTYLTAYAHNQKLLVKEDQAVKRGQRIAEMGSTDANRVQLHFEIRRGGKPVDPAKILPSR